MSTLEIFACEDDFKHFRTPVIKIDLKNVISVESNVNSKRFANCFLLCCKDNTKIYLACFTELEKQSWIQALQILAEKRRIIYVYKDLSLLPSKLKAKSKLKSLYHSHKEATFKISTKSQIGAILRSRSKSDPYVKESETASGSSYGPPTAPRPGDRNSDLCEQHNPNGKCFSFVFDSRLVSCATS